MSLGEAVAVESALREAEGERLTRLLLEAPGSALAAALDNPRLEETHLLLALRRADLEPALLDKVGQTLPWSAKYLVKAALVAHPHTPRTLALNLVKHLFWRDLARLVANFQVVPAVRRQAEVTLAERIPEISTGERMALARVAPREVVRALRAERDPRVVAALLDNARLTEEDVQILIHDRHAPPEVLATIARSERWMGRSPLRVALLGRPQIPLAAAWPLLARMGERELERVAECVEAASGIRATARRLLGERARARGN